jgi:hypothetical protein
MAAYTCLLRICSLAADVVSLFVLRSLPSNESTRYNMSLISRSLSLRGGGGGAAAAAAAQFVSYWPVRGPKSRPAASLVY